MASYSDNDYGFLGIDGLKGDYMVKVTNLSPQVVDYVLPELNLSRSFAAATNHTTDTKQIQFHELYTLYQSPGGPQLIFDHLQIKDNSVREALSLPADPEFDYSQDGIRKLISEGTELEIVDALDFGPFYLAQWMKNIIIVEGLNDHSKRQFFSKLFHMNIDSAQDNFDWATQNSNVGSQYAAMKAPESNTRSRRTLEVEKEGKGRKRRA